MAEREIGSTGAVTDDGWQMTDGTATVAILAAHVLLSAGVTCQAPATVSRSMWQELPGALFAGWLKLRGSSMSQIRNHRDLEAWRTAMEFCSPSTGSVPNSLRHERSFCPLKCDGPPLGTVQHR